jgi:hypothetical protein
MDMELLIWVLVFVGGYSVVVGWLLGIALGNQGDPGSDDPGGRGRDEAGGAPPGRGDGPGVPHLPA